MQGTKIRKDTWRKPSASRAVQAELPRVLEIGDRVHGRVARWFDQGWGYGFIHVDGADDVFVSARELQNADRLYRGDRVAFDVALDGQGRFQARHAVLVDGMPITPMSVSPEVFPPAPWEDA